MRSVRLVAVVLGFALLVPAPAGAASWGGIYPGETTLEQVRERYGAPSKETKQKIENYDTTTWIYEGSQAPVGMTRMVVDFGILRPDGFKADLVRVFELEPKPTIFALQTVIDGWGLPSVSGNQDAYPTMFYEEGLVVIFDKETLWAKSMTFTVPQPLPQPPAAGAAPAPAPAGSSAPAAPKPRTTAPAGPRP